MTPVKALGYIGCSISDSKAWEKLMFEVFALQKRNDSPKKTLQYRIDDNHHRLSLYKSSQDKLDYIGWEVETQDELDDFAADLKDKGVKITHADSKLKAERAVMDLYIIEGPDGVQNEIFFGPVQDYVPFNQADGRSGFNTEDLGMGHVVLASANRESTLDWYQNILGLTLSDHIYWDGIEATFMHCNPRHHSLAIMNTVGPMKNGDLGHFMLEANSADDVGRAYDVVEEKKYPVAFTYGKHTNDLTTSFYLYTPSNWLIEYGYGGTLIDDEIWEPKLYNSPKIWGHNHQLPPEANEDAAARK
ncbi:MAG: biphenyl 2,3-dioxygenase [Gammaproteobacteria bacterium]|nr:biphenyl 2,3-dioxygenase [Gammaproteobacteria bacterium]